MSVAQRVQQDAPEGPSEFRVHERVDDRIEETVEISEPDDGDNEPPVENADEQGLRLCDGLLGGSDRLGECEEGGIRMGRRGSAFKVCRASRVSRVGEAEDRGDVEREEGQPADQKGSEHDGERVCRAALAVRGALCPLRLLLGDRDDR